MTSVLRWLSVAGCVGAAGFLAWQGVEGWGWFLLIAVLIA